LTEDPLYGVESHYFSTVKAINQLSSNTLGVPLIKASSSDRNRDDLLDELKLQIEVKSLPGRKLPITQAVRQVRLLGTVDYELSEMLQLEMIGMFQVVVPTPSGASVVDSSG
jgi:hypothetical protein